MTCALRNIRGDSGSCIAPVGQEHLRLILSENHSQGSAYAYQHIGADAGRSALADTLQTQQTAQQQCQR